MCAVDLREKIVEARARLAELETLYYGKVITGDDPEPERVQRLHEIRTRLAAATPGTWLARASSVNPEQVNVYLPREGPIWDRVPLTMFSPTKHRNADAELIGNAPVDLAYLCAEVELLQFRAGFFRDAYEDAKNNKQYINMAADQANRADEAIAELDRIESQAREQAALLKPVLEAFREYMTADAYLDATSEPDSGATEDEISDIWHVLDTAHEKLLEALGKLDEAIAPKEEAFQPDSFDWVPLLDVPPGAIFETGAGVRAVRAKHDGNHLVQVPCIVLGTGETAVFPDGNLEMVRQVPV